MQHVETNNYSLCFLILSLKIYQNTKHISLFMNLHFLFFHGHSKGYIKKKMDKIIHIGINFLIACFKILMLENR